MGLRIRDQGLNFRVAQTQHTDQRRSSPSGQGHRQAGQRGLMMGELLVEGGPPLENFPGQFSLRVEKIVALPRVQSWDGAAATWVGLSGCSVSTGREAPADRRYHSPLEKRISLSSIWNCCCNLASRLVRSRVRGLPPHGVGHRHVQNLTL